MGHVTSEARPETRHELCWEKRSERCRSGETEWSIMGKHTYSRTWATMLGSLRPPRKGTGDGPQEWEWEWVYHPRSKGERGGVQGRQTRLPGCHSAGEVSCEAETLMEAGGHGDQKCLSLKKQKSPRTEQEERKP